MGRKTLLYLIAATIVIVSMSSCEKEHRVYQGNRSGGSGATGKKLVKVTRQFYEKFYDKNYSLQHTYGSIEGMRYQWSGNNITDLIDWEYENGSLVEESGGGQFIYDGNNLTEIRIQEEGYQSNYYLTYNSGQITEIYNTWNEGSDAGWMRKTMTYSSDGHLQEAIKTYSQGGVSSGVSRYLMTWNGDNIISVQQFYNGSLEWTENYTYDNKKSAYAEMPEWWALMDNDWKHLSANNVILERGFYSDEETDIFSYTYTYESDYPVKCIITSNSDPHSTIYGTTYYEYADGTGTSQVPQQVCIINATANNDDWGYVLGGGEYAAGSTVVLYADPYLNEDSHFLQWSDGSTQNPRTIIANGNANYTANFATSSGGGGSSNTAANVSFNGISWDASSIYAHSARQAMQLR